MSKPVIVTVDDEPGVLNAIERDCGGGTPRTTES